MSERKYTWAQIAGQVDAVMSQYRAMAALQEMLAEAAQVEQYLEQQQQTQQSMEGRLAETREALQQIAQEFVDLQQAAEVEKKEYQEAKNAMYKTAQAHKQQHETAMAALDVEYEARIAELNAKAEQHEKCCDEAAKIIDTEIDEKHQQLADVKWALRELKEKL